MKHNKIRQKRNVHKSVWYGGYSIFATLLIIFSTTAVLSLRQNNATMVRLWDAVKEADKAGGDTETALRNLRRHIAAHMNTSLHSSPNAISMPVQLVYSYQRAVEAENKRISDIRTGYYNAAQSECEQLYAKGKLSDRVKCVQDRLDRAPQISAKNIIPEQYQYDFVSPWWTPDLAGWSLLLSLASLSSLVLVFAAHRYHRQIQWLEQNW